MEVLIVNRVIPCVWCLCYDPLVRELTGTGAGIAVECCVICVQ